MNQASRSVGRGILTLLAVAAWATAAGGAGPVPGPSESGAELGREAGSERPTEPDSDGASAPTPANLAQLMRGMAGSAGVVASFREVKELALLSAPLESRGTLYFVPPDRLARFTREPSPTRLLIDGDRFVFHDVTGGEAIDLSSNPVAAEVVSNFIVLFNGDLVELERRYEPSFRAGEGRWSLELVPRQRPLSDVVVRVLLEGAGRSLVRMELLEAGGDRSTTWFEDVRSDHAFSEAELAGIFDPDGGVVAAGEPGGPVDAP